MKIPAYIIRDKKRRDEERRRKDEINRIPLEAPEIVPPYSRRIERPSDGRRKPGIIVIEL